MNLPSYYLNTGSLGSIKDSGELACPNGSTKSSWCPYRVLNAVREIDSSPNSIW